MSDPDFTKYKIQEELQKGLPSKRKILSLLLDLLKKDIYPSLSDSEFYEIVGYTYQLNLDYKLNLDMLFYPIYNQLQKRIKKLYGDDKRVEMEQYLIENFNFSNRVKKNVSQTQNLKEARSTSSKVIRFVSFLLFLIAGILVLIVGITIYFSSPSVSFFKRGFVIVVIAVGVSLIIVSIFFVSR
ncbi:MAG: hypothetical protein EAX91_01725 [Candidatus Lokiarchaeota archaeon]|nr:hypothetical protein [Candidatus Lokiarchaeota archaeon]